MNNIEIVVMRSSSNGNQKIIKPFLPVVSDWYSFYLGLVAINHDRLKICPKLKIQTKRIVRHLFKNPGSWVIVKLNNGGDYKIRNSQIYCFSLYFSEI